MTLVRASIVIFVIILMKSSGARSGPRNRSTPLSVNHEIFGSTRVNRLTNEIVDNFNNALDTALKFSDFQPHVISIGHSGSRGQIHEIVTNYLRQRQLAGYNYDLDELSEKSLGIQTATTWIILVDELNFFHSKINEIMNFWTSANRLIIFSLDEKEQRWTNVFRNLWNRRSISKALISSANEKFRYVYRFLPFEKGNGDFGRVQRLDMEKKICDDRDMILESLASARTERIKCPWDQEHESRSYQKSIFEDFRTLNSYAIRVTVFPSLMMNISRNKKNETVYEMLDANVMKLMEERLSANFIIEPLATTSRIDPFNEALRKLDAKEKSEFVFTGYFTKFYDGNYEFTTSILQDKLCLIAPSSSPIPKYFMPLLPFTNELWLILIIYNLVIALLWLLIQYIDRRFRAKVDPTSVKITIESSIQLESRKKSGEEEASGLENHRGGDSFKKRHELWNKKFKRRLISNSPPPKIHWSLTRFFDFSILSVSPLQGGKTITERAFLIGPLFFGLIMIGLYQSCLVSSLSKPIYYPQLKTLCDVADSNRTIVTKYENLLHNIPNDGSSEIQKLRSKVQILNTDKKTYDMVAHGGMISLGRFSSFELENLTEYHDPETSRLLLHMVEECPATYFLAYVVRLSSPYLERIDCLLLRMQQSGLIDKWYRDMLRTVEIATSETRHKRREKRVKLSLAHLSLVFLGLGIGLALSTQAFIGERHFSMKNRSTKTSLMLRKKIPSTCKNLREIMGSSNFD